MKKTIRPTIQIQTLATPDQGKQLELVAIDETGNPEKNVCYPILAIVADSKDESIWFEIYTDTGPVQISLPQIQKAIEVALNEVRSEAWYEKNVYSSSNES